MKNINEGYRTLLKKASLVEARKRPEQIVPGGSPEISSASLLREIEENTRKEFLLERRFKPSIGDIPFDHTSARRINSLAGYNVVGFRLPILTYRVPPSADMIITQFNFFVMLGHYQPLPLPRAYGSPLEFSANYCFLIEVNGAQPIIATHDIAMIGKIGAVTQSESGFITITEDPNTFPPNYNGMHIHAPKGSNLEVVFRCHTNEALPPAQRDLYIAGSRIRGFLTGSEDLDKKNK